MKFDYQMQISVIIFSNAIYALVGHDHDDINMMIIILPFQDTLKIQYFSFFLDEFQVP